MNEPLYLQIGDRVADRYRIVSILGQGGSGVTYGAEDLDSHQQCALKQLSLKGMTHWKQLELFEREAQVLSQLDYPGIPNYIDYFQTDTEQNRCFYIVQELAPGRSLADLVQEGWRASEAEVRQLGVKVLDILKYLHDLTPPIIHRDIKPQNIIRSDDGQIYLVDFGAVQHVYQTTMAGSTVVGTYGYMAPEHFQGKAGPATDLYSLGATLLFLLTHCSPADLPQQRLKIDFRKAVQLQPDFATWLDRLLEPAVEDRLPSAQAALAALTQSSPRSVRRQSFSQRKRHQPKGSKVQIQRTPCQITVDIPPCGWRGKVLGMEMLALFAEGFLFALMASGLISMFKMIEGPIPVEMIFAFVLPLLIGGILLMAAILFGLAGRIHVQINPQQFQICWYIDRLGLRYGQTLGNTKALNGVRLTAATANSDKLCTLIEGGQRHTFGTMLSLPEKEWLVHEISDFLWLQQHQSQQPTTSER